MLREPVRMQGLRFALQGIWTLPRELVGVRDCCPARAHRKEHSTMPIHVYKHAWSSPVVVHTPNRYSPAFKYAQSSHRSLLSRFGPVRTALPPFAATRRDILAVRRAQTQAAGPPGLGSLPPPVPTSLSVVVPSSSGEVAAGGRTPLPGAVSLSLPTALPSASSGGGPANVLGVGVASTVGGGGVGAGGGGVVSPVAYRQPRPPPARPMDMLEQLGFPVSKEEDGIT